MFEICLGCMEAYDDNLQICPHCGYAKGMKAAEALHMEPGSILRGRYIVGRVLGFGGFGVTYICRDALLEQKVAIKEYLPSEFSTRIPGQTQVTVFDGDKGEQFHNGMAKFIDEAKRLAKFHNLEGIVRIIDSFTDNNTAYIIMEYLEGETLAERLKRQAIIPPAQAVAMLIPVIRSMRAVHEQGIIHRDIAPDNIFLTSSGYVKLIDFGAARFATTSHSRSLTVIIKPGYSPEEQYRSRGDQGAHTDVYAISATLYRMITGIAPPDALERRAFFESKQKDILKPISAFCKEITTSQEAAIMNALNVRIEDRTPDMAELEAELTSEGPIKRRQGRIKRLDVFKWPLRVKIMASTLMLTIISLCALFATGVIKLGPVLQTDIVIPKDMSRVPSVVSNSLEEAERRLNQPPDVILLYQIVGREYSDQIIADLILSQDIGAGSIVAHYTTLKLIISGGLETNTVPDITGMNVDDAVQALEALGFVVNIETEYSQVFAENAVISQSVAGNEKLGIGAVITLTVSIGIDPNSQYERKITDVPAFVGKSYEDAQIAAAEAGLLLTIISREYSDEFDEGVVMTQSAAAGSLIMSGDVIELTVSLGPELVEIVNVQYLTEAEAAAILENLGLIVEVAYVQDSTIQSGLVKEQSPAAQTMVRPGETISLFVVSDSARSGQSGQSGQAGQGGQSGQGSQAGQGGQSPQGGLGGQGSQGDRSNRSEQGGQSDQIDPGSMGGQSDQGGQGDMSGPSNQGDQNDRDDLSGQGGQNSQSGIDDQSSQSGQGNTGGQVDQNDRSALSGQSNGDEQRNGDGLSNQSNQDSQNNPNSQIGESGQGSQSDQSGQTNQDSQSGESGQGNINDQSGLNDQSGQSSRGGENGRESATVPNVVGRTDSAARNTLISQGFIVEYRADAFSDTVPKGNVMTQSPTAGVAAYKGDIVTLTISLGKNIPEPILPTAVAVEPANLTLIVGGTQQISAAVLPTNAEDKSISWKSGNTSVASVTNDGVITARAEGTTTITAMSNADNTKIGTCTVTVIKNVEYTVTFDANGGAVAPSSQTVGAGGSIAMPTPTKSCSITFDANGGSVSPSSMSVPCSFNGWYTAAAGGTPVGSGSYAPTGNTTLYAQYSFQSAGALPVPTKDDALFLGWVTADSIAVADSTVITENISLIAMWLELND